jgi:hypothetical protein
VPNNGDDRAELRVSTVVQSDNLAMDVMLLICKGKSGIRG